MDSDNTLIVFVKNPKLGEVKTRLARTIGQQQALSVYHTLLRICHDTVVPLSVRKTIFYSDEITENDIWEDTLFEKYVQRGRDIGERMFNAISDCNEGAEGAMCLIGTDIPDLSKEIIDSAFELLTYNDVVIGPAEDGGYYLIAMRKPVKEIFVDKTWGTGMVLKETLAELEKSALTFKLLPVLNDIDTIEDIRNGGYNYLLQGG
ncbi:MAG: glycosyltransferase [Cyclobacteriaceae bacterium]|nr:glycosyltransferase [Cyclobacteriaceae bacterium]